MFGKELIEFIMTEARLARKRRLYVQFSAFVVSVLLLLPVVNAQAAPNNDIVKGRVVGSVVDSETGEPLIGANVFFQGTNIGSATDLEGDYEISAPPGRYDLVVSVIGYTKKTVSGVRVASNEVEKYNISLPPEALETEEVVVTASMIRNTEAALLKQRQKALAVSDAISAEAISRSGSGDAAAAMKKVTGASVVGGKYVYIRGLGERYSSTALNGVELPSADPDKKSFQLDLFPSSLLDNITTLKTFTPDKPGTFSGGLVDVTTKSFPEKFFLQVSSSASYNTSATFQDAFVLPNGGGSDWLAIDDGTRGIPDPIMDPNTNIPVVREITTRDQAMFIDNMMSDFSTTMAPLEADAPVNQSFSLAAGNQYPVTEKSSIGYLTSVTWGQNYSFYDDGQVGRWFLSGPIDDVDGLNENRLLDDQKGTREVSWGGMFRLAYKNKSFGHISGTYMHTQSAESSARFLNGFWRDIPSAPFTESSLETRVLSWVERSLNSYQLDGKHQLPWFFKSNFEWRASYASNVQDEPDQRYFSNLKKSISRPDQNERTLFELTPSLLPPPIRYYRDLDENNFTTSADLSIPFKQWGGQNSKLQLGVLYTDVDREYRQRRFDYQLRSSFSDFAPDVNTYFAQAGLIDSSAADPADWVFGHTVIENKTPKNIFSGNQETIAGYFMADVPIVARKLRFVGGVRLESTEMRGFSPDTTIQDGELNDTDWLPSLNLIYQFTDNMNLRLAYTNTVARPTFRELAPYRNFEFVTDFLVEGNPNLERTLIRNYDVRWEWFPNPGEILAVSGFFKDFENPIERFQDAGVPNGLQSVKNVESARIYGIELEIRKGLGVIAPALDYFSLGSNFSLVESEVDIPDTELITIRANDPDAADTRDFQGQSPYIFNLDLAYTHPGWNLNADLLYNVFGDRLAIITLGAEPDVFERSFGALDFKVSKRFRNLKVSLAAKNILDPDVKFSQELDGQEFIYTKYKRGSTYSLSLGYDL